MRLNGNMNTKNRWETYYKIPYRGGRFIIESKNNRYTVVANLGYLQRQFKNHYYLSSATNSTFLWILVFIFFPVFLCFALRSEQRLTYCHKYVSRSNRYFKIQWRGRQRERKKTIGFISKTITLHVCITLISTFLCRFCTSTTWNCLISRFMDYVNKQRPNFISLS